MPGTASTARMREEDRGAATDLSRARVYPARESKTRPDANSGP